MRRMTCTSSTRWARCHLFKVNVTMPASAHRHHQRANRPPPAPDQSLTQIEPDPSRCKLVGLRRMSIGDIKWDENIGILGARA